ncbi:MAG: hypothetical protein E7014_00195 [Alphaproteobacteria bacterium]|nr:hypothetical protein [Alphaproteobacteria bacterium]
MAESLMSEEQIAKLLTATDGEMAEMEEFFSGTPVLQPIREIRVAAQTGDMGRLQQAMNQVSVQTKPEVFQQVQATVQRDTFVRQTVQAVQAYHYLQDKKEKQEQALSAEEEQFMEQKPQLEAGVSYLRTNYAQAFQEGPLPQAETEQVNSVVQENEARMDTYEQHGMFETKSGMRDYRDAVEPQTGTLETGTVEFKPDTPLYTEHLDLSQPDTTINMTDTGNTADVNFSPDVEMQTGFAPQPMTDNTADGETKTVDFTGTPHSENETIRSGNTFEMSQEAKEMRDLHDAFKVGTNEPDKAEEDIRKLNDSFADKGQYGYVDGVKLGSADKRKTDWETVYKQGVSKHIDKIGSEKDMADFALDILVAGIMVPLDSLKEYLKQKRLSQKEDAKKAVEKRGEFIADNLRNRGLSKLDLSTKLARDGQKWILQDPNYAIIPEKGPYTKYEKALLEKREFAKRLPTKSDGSVDFDKMSSSQRKKYGQYLATYAHLPEFKNYVYEMTGIKQSYDEMKQIVSASKEMENVSLMSPDEQVAVQQAKIQELEQTVADLQASTKGQAPNGISSPNNVQSNNVQPTAGLQSSTKEQVPNGMPSPNNVQSSGVQPTADLQASTDVQNPNIVQSSTGVKAPKQVSNANNVRETKADAVQHGSNGVQSPKNVRDNEHERQKAEALASVQMDDLAEVRISGTVKNPVVTMPDGTRMPVDNRRKEELDAQARDVDRKKKANDEAASANRQRQRQLAMGRSGQTPTYQAPKPTRTTGRAM